MKAPYTVIDLHLIDFTATSASGEKFKSVRAFTGTKRELKKQAKAWAQSVRANGFKLKATDDYGNRY
jgi:hypothetical protein